MDKEHDSENKRHFSRIAMDSTVRLLCDSSAAQEAKLIDISLKGALFTQPDNWTGQTGDACRIEVQLGSTDTIIRMEGSIAHAEKGHLGFHCEHIDLKSISHLKRLIELNLGDESVLERELTELVVPGN